VLNKDKYILFIVCLDNPYFEKERKKSNAIKKVQLVRILDNVGKTKASDSKKRPSKLKYFTVLSKTKVNGNKTANLVKEEK